MKALTSEQKLYILDLLKLSELKTMVIDEVKYYSEESVLLLLKKALLSQIEGEGEEKKAKSMIITIEQRTEEIICNNPYSIHPSRLAEWQFREAIRFLAKEIDILHKLRIKTPQQ